MTLPKSGTTVPIPGMPTAAPLETCHLPPPSSDHPDRVVTVPVVSDPWVGKRRARRKR